MDKTLGSRQRTVPCLTYCGNAPVLFSDGSGYRYAEHAGALGSFDPTKSHAVTKEEIKEAIELSSGDWAHTRGVFRSVTLGMYNFAGTLEFAIDTEGNVQFQSSVSFDVTSAGSLAVTGGQCGSVFHVPDVSSLAGDTTYIGGSITALIPECLIPINGSANAAQTSDGYWGMTYALGITTPIMTKPLEWEAHAGYSYTHVWMSFNVKELFGFIIL